MSVMEFKLHIIKETFNTDKGYRYGLFFFATVHS